MQNGTLAETARMGNILPRQTVPETSGLHNNNRYLIGRYLQRHPVACAYLHIFY